MGNFFCHIRSCNDGCNINKQKVDFIFIHSITQISTAPITELIYTELICNKAYEAFKYEILKLDISTFHNVSIFYM